MRRGRWSLAFLAAAVAGGVAVAVVLRLGGEAAEEPVGLPAPPAPAFSIPLPRPLDGRSPAAYWTVVERPTEARTAPARRAPVQVALSPRTPEGTANVVLVLGKRADERGALWIRVALSSTEGSASGWVPRSALGAYHAVRTRLVVDLERQTVTLRRDGRPVFSAPVGVGTAGFPTPRGEFFVRSRLTKFTGPFYGPIAFGTSARSPAATDWPGGGVVGIHGTDRPELLPGRVSHGCIRLRNDDIVRLARLMPVGTPLTIR